MRITTKLLPGLLLLSFIFARQSSGENTVFLGSPTYAVSENAGSAAIVVQVTRDAGNEETITVDYATADGTATQPSDYLLTAGTITFAPNETAKLVQVPIIDDRISESSEFFTIKLSNSNASITRDMATVTINDNDGTGDGINIIEFTSIDYGTVETLGRGVANPVKASITLVLTAQRRGDPNQPLTVDVVVGQPGDTAQPGLDYVDLRPSPPAPTVTFPPGIDRVNVTIEVEDRLEAQGNTFFTAIITNPGQYVSVGQQSEARCTIFDNEGPNTVQLLTDAIRIQEGVQASISIPVFRTGSPDPAGTNVNFTTELRSGDTAQAGVNFLSTSGTVFFKPLFNGPTFADDEHQGFITIFTPNNELIQGDVTFHLTLTSSDIAQLGPVSSTQITVGDDDNGNVVQFSAANYTVSEGGSYATITVKLIPNGDPSQSTLVDFAATPITAYGGYDFLPVVTTLVFGPEEYSKTVSVPILDDNITESPETFRVTLSNPSIGSVLGAQSTSIVTILDNDLANIVQFSATDYSVAENAGSVTLNVVANRANDPNDTITVHYQTVSNTAIGGQDYTSIPPSPSPSPYATLIFNPGETAKTITVSIINEKPPLIEGAENFFVDLIDASSKTMKGDESSSSIGTNNRATVTILDDDSPTATIGFSQDSFNVDEGSGFANLTVTRSGGLGVSATVNYATSNGTAVSGVNYIASSGRVTFAVGEVSKIIQIPIIDDATADPTLTFTVTLTADDGTGFVGGRAQATVDIIDNDATTFRFNPSTYTVDEGSGSVTLTVEALRVGDPSETISVDFVTSDGTAQAGSNYTRTSGRLTFGPDISSQTITVPIIDNSSTEGTTTFTVTLSNPLGEDTDNPPRLGTPSSATVSIIDNDATTFQFSLPSYTASNQAGVASATVTLSRIGDPNITYSVSYATSDLTAMVGRDYIASSGKLTFGPGVTSQVIKVYLIKEPVGEPTRQFQITLSNPTNGAFLGTTSSTIINITNPDLSTKPTNISTRGLVESGDGVMIAGFIIDGPSTKQVIIRGLGPSLTQRGVVGALQDPTLDLRDAGGIQLLFNDDFAETQEADIAATGLAPTDSRESAIVATLAPGRYTAILRGKTNGVGLVEVYDLESTSGTHLVNISTRAMVGPDDNTALIGGFIVDGQVSQQMLIRALGPSLTAAGVDGALANPTIDFYRGSQLILSNDDWKSDDQAGIQATGIPPADDKEAAILVTLDPGSYTAVIRGKNNSTGVSLVEVYQIK